MYPRFAFALLFSVCAFGLGIAIPALPVNQKCGANARFSHCGSACVPDCANPEKPLICTHQCVMGCFCEEGFLKNSKGECVRPQDCEAPTHPRIPIQKPEPAFPTCPDNEEFRTCGSACAPDCANPIQSPLCTKNCVIGCFCKEGHLRNTRGACVPAHQCEAPETSMLFAYPPEVSQCKENEMFMPCGSACAPTCANPLPGPMCTRQCVVGCFCKPGYLKNEQGECVAAENCGVPASQAFPMPPQVCGENEEFRQCKGCDGTCDKPNPICPRICVSGCACKQGHLRSGANGMCVPAKQCNAPAPASIMMLPPTHKCPTDREFYVKECGTQLDCMATCGTPRPFLIRGVPQMPKKCAEKQCAASCVCKHPYVRNANGQCVERNECEAVHPFTPTPAA